MEPKLILLFITLLFSPIICTAAPFDIETSQVGLSILSFFGIGIMLAFTPCVLPMVPILSSILIRKNKSNKTNAFKISFAFVLGMAIAYACVGLFASYLGSSLQTVLQIPLVFITFSGIIFIMALSMFGLFELRIPKFLLTHAQHFSDQQKTTTLFGVTIMGMVSTLIASPCITAPMVAILTFISEQGNPYLGSLMLFVLAFGMGTPLILFAIGQNALIPKTGAWMITIKKLFGVIMVGLSIWMISRLLPGNITLLLFAILILVSAIEFGALDLQAKTPRFLHGLSFLALVYGIILFVGAASGNDDLFQPLHSIAAQTSQNPKRSMQELFTPVNTLAEIKKQLNQAKLQQKPVVLDFYAAWCPVCRALDKNVFSDKKIQDLLNNFVVLRIDLTKDNEELQHIRQRYQVYGVPSIVFYDKQGEEITSDRAKELTKSFVEKKLLELS